MASTWRIKYKMTVGGEKRYLYAKMHVKYGKEVPYCILFDKPEKVETSAPPKKRNSACQKTVDIGISMRDLLLANTILTTKVATISETSK